MFLSRPMTPRPKRWMDVGTRELGGVAKEQTLTKFEIKSHSINLQHSPYQGREDMGLEPNVRLLRCPTFRIQQTIGSSAITQSPDTEQKRLQCKTRSRRLGHGMI